MRRLIVLSLIGGLLLSLSGVANAEGLVCPAASKFVDVNISNQLLTECQDGVVVKTIHISSGSERRYHERGSDRRWHSGIAHTPRGEFEAGFKVPGRLRVPLGVMYWPVFFSAHQYAIHGSLSVPNYPASHGCVRIPMSEAPAFYNWAERGTPISVHD